MKSLVVIVSAFIILNLGSLYIISYYHSKEIRTAIEKETTTIKNEISKIKVKKGGQIDADMNNIVPVDSSKTTFWMKLFNPKKK